MKHVLLDASLRQWGVAAIFSCALVSCNGARNFGTSSGGGTGDQVNTDFGATTTSGEDAGTNSSMHAQGATGSRNLGAGAPGAAGSGGEGGAGGSSEGDADGGIGETNSNPGGAGGVSSGGSSGGMSNGGVNSGGGANSAAGAASIGCMKEPDCTSPDPVTCSVACVDHECVASSRGTTLASGPATATLQTGIWDDNNSPYLVYVTPATAPLGIEIQPLQADGGVSGVLGRLSLSDGVAEVTTLAAHFSAGEVGLLWETHENVASPGVYDISAQFVVTDVTAKDATVATLSSISSLDKYDTVAYGEFVHRLGKDRWLLAQLVSGIQTFWYGTVATPGVTPAEGTLNRPAESLGYSPSCSLSGCPVSQSAVVVGSSLFLSGFDCDWYIPACLPSQVVARYDANTLESQGTALIFLTVNPVEYVAERQRTPVLADLGGKLGALWTEFFDDNEFELGRAIFNEDGSVATARSLAPSSLIPKALVGVPSGGGLLIASQIDISGASVQHTLIAQRVTDELAFVGAPYSISEAALTEPRDVKVQLSPDGQRVLVNFVSDRARHRVLNAQLCQE